MEVYKIVNILGPKYLNKMFVGVNIFIRLTTSKCLYNVYKLVCLYSPYGMSNCMNIGMSKFNTAKYGKSSISYTGKKLWNILNN